MPTKPTKPTTKTITFKIGNLTIEKGKKYVLDHKFDGSAPDGLKSLEATRLPFERNSLVDAVYFDELQNLYDTGFYTQSISLSRYKQAERDELVPVYIKEIKEPYEKIINKILSQNSDNEFYKNYRYESYVNKEFDTNNPVEFFDLFNAIIQGIVCAKDERDPFYRSQAQFNLSNPTDVKNKSKEKTKRRRTAFEKFSTMATSNRDKLNLILEFIGKDNPAKIESDDLKDIYYEVIHEQKTGMDFVDRFLEASDKYEGDQGKLEMEYFAAVKRLDKAGKIKKTRTGYVTTTGEQFLGTTLQSIASFCILSGSKQKEIIDELVEDLI
jgi:hypothetical protein|tara:strand:+ start:4443 stop:5420 length:978 start_codon:yes stop_codon:yes gene_type:complete